MIKAKYTTQGFHFVRPATTSRGTYYQKTVHYIILYHTDDPSLAGIGECSLLPGLSYDTRKDFTGKLQQVVDHINNGHYESDPTLKEWPSIAFALETAWRDLRVMGSKVVYPSDFTNGKDSLRINGLIWMGDKEDMFRQVKQKLNDGFSCIKLKVGALFFDDELEILRWIRKQFSPDEVEIRLDANGSFKSTDAVEILKILSDLHIHSIEQPISANHSRQLANVCESSPIPVALDESLIGKHENSQRRKLLDTIKPKYIVLKPGLLGGISACKNWIELAEERKIAWWITSSLETNIGLNTIAQWTYTLKNETFHGLSTGALFRDNIISPMYLHGEKLYYDPDRKWDLTSLNE